MKGTAIVQILDGRAEISFEPGVGYRRIRYHTPGWLRHRGLAEDAENRASEVKQGLHATSPAAKACILIWLDGGPSHLETFDPKPEAQLKFAAL